MHGCTRARAPQVRGEEGRDPIRTSAVRTLTACVARSSIELRDCGRRANSSPQAALRVVRSNVGEAQLTTLGPRRLKATLNCLPLGWTGAQRPTSPRTTPTRRRARWPCPALFCSLPSCMITQTRPQSLCALCPGKNSATDIRRFRPRHVYCCTRVGPPAPPCAWARLLAGCELLAMARCKDTHSTSVGSSAMAAAPAHPVK